MIGVAVDVSRATITTLTLQELGARRRARGAGRGGGGSSTGMMNTATGAGSSCSPAPRRYSIARSQPCGRGRRRHHAQAVWTTSMLVLLLAAAALSPQGARALDEITEVAAPNTTLTAGDTHAVEWVYTTDSLVSGTTGDLHPFEIELRSCTPEDDGSCGASCGNAYRALCGLETGASCMDSDGSYDIVIPEDVASGTYVFSVTFLGTTGWSSASSSSSSSGAVAGCSDSFTVDAMDADDASGAMDVLTATTPTENLKPGDPFTAEWDYDDGAAGNFEVNLYSCAEDACVNGR